MAEKSIFKIQNFIGGEFVDPLSNQWFERASPSTGLGFSKVPSSEVLDVVKAVQSANRVLPNWLKSEVEERSVILENIAQALFEKKTEWARIFSEETGAPISSHAIESVERAIELFRFSARADLSPQPQSLANDMLSFTHRSPIGLVAIITSWVDAPALLASRIAPALCAGNALIVKPSSFAPRTANFLAELLSTIPGLLPGVLSFVQGRGEAVGQTLVSHPGISTISFTGRTETGRAIQASAAEFLKRTHLALSGSNSIAVFAGVPLEKTAQAVARISVSGEVAISLKASRIFIQESIYKEFLEAFKAAVAKIAIGNPLLESTRLGPLINADSRDRFKTAVSQATVEKGKLLIGGEAFPQGLDQEMHQGNFVLPTVVFDSSQCSTLQQEEVPGPFAMISSFKYQNDAIKFSNTSPLGQAIYLFHADAGKALKIAAKLDAGRVFVNPSRSLWDPRMTFGGLRDSGLGAEGGVEGLKFFTKASLITQDLA